MSNRDSLGFGDLLPQDVVDIFAQEKLSKKSRKQRSRSLGRALGWLKGKKKKHVENKEQNPGLGPAFDMALDTRPVSHQGTPKGALKSGKQSHQQSNSHAVPKRDDSDEKAPAPLLLQENVFIEVSRPKYLEDLHSEALEGLKLMQQEERITGPEYHDNESTISTVSVRAEVDGGGFTTDSTIPDTSSTVSVKSSVSSRSSRSGLTRQGSTFRPLNSGKKSDKGKVRRRHRKTIAGIPQHLQREFGLDRADWTVGPHLEEEFVNGDSDVPQLAVHSPPDTNTEVVHPLIRVQEEQLSAAQTAHVDDLALLRQLGPAQSGGDRPWSLAVPGMTTAGNGQSGPPSPVMSMSPQAAYLSKIIPNAVLPPSIEVVEISRGSSRNSVRTVSKSSLVLSSPTSSRASSRASTARSTSSRSSTITSASRQNHFHLSDSSCWSNSDSDTLVSDSSTISSSSTPRQREAQDKVSKKQNSSVHIGSPKYPSNGKLIKENQSNKEGPFVRSLSVMKPKRAPPPPSRSYSLHNKLKRRSRDLADVKVVPQSEENIKKRIDSPGYNADTSSLDESTGSKTPSPLKPQQIMDPTKNNVFIAISNAKTEPIQTKNDSNVISPSSGYSSQDATSPQKSPKHKKGLLAKLHKLFPASPSADLSTSAVTKTNTSKNAPVVTASDKPSVKALKEFFSIPPHPKVQAPPPPPPEVWSHSPRSIELILGPPAHGNTYAVVKKNPKDKRPYRPPASISADSTVKVGESKQNSTTVETKKVHESQEGSLNVTTSSNNFERLTPKNIDVKEHGIVQVSEINSVLVRTVDRDTDRLPAIAEEHKIITQNTTNPSISSVHISPRLPSKQNAAVPVITLHKAASPESSWPPPPPPLSQVSVGSPDETDLPLPPPPVFTETEIILPVQVPPDKQASNVSISIQGDKSQPLNIPPPPNYTAPPPPVKTFSEKVKLFSPPTKDVSSTTSNITVTPPPPALTQTLPSTPAQFINDSTPFPADKKTHVIPPTPEATPPQKLALDILSSTIIHAPTIKSTSFPSKSAIPPPPDIIPPPPTKKEIAVPCTAPDFPTHHNEMNEMMNHNEAPLSVEEVKGKLTEASSSNTLVAKTEASIPPPAAVSEAPSKGVLTPPSGSSPPEVAVLPPVEAALIPSEVSNVTPQIEVTQPPAEVTVSSVVSIPQAEVVSEPLVEEISRPQDVPELNEMSTPLPEEAQSDAPLPTDTSLLKEVTPASEKHHPLTEDPSSPEIVVEEAKESHVTEERTPSVVEEKFLPVVVDVSYQGLSEETCTDALEDSLEESLKPSEEDETSLVEEAPSIASPNNDSKESAAEQEIEDSEQEILVETSTPTLWKSILTPPQSIPPPPPIEQLASNTLPSHEPIKPQDKPELPNTDQIPPEPEVPPLTESTSLVPPVTEVLEQQPPSDTTEEHNEAPVDDPAVEEESQTDNCKENIIVQPSIIEEIPIKEPPAEEPSEAPTNNEEEESSKANSLENAMSPSVEEVPNKEPASENAEKKCEASTVVEDSQNANSITVEAVNGSPESPKTDNEEKTKNKEETPQISPTSEVPQKPVRRSLVISPPSSPPAMITKSPSPTTTKSPPVMAPSMNLQEAIRLRTAARAHNGPSSRFGMHSTPGFDVRKSPTTTASFVFSKSHKKVVIEARSEAKPEKKTEELVTKPSGDETIKKEFKVPPPVAKKPKTKNKEVEGGEQTAGQETHSDTDKNISKKPNGSAVEGH